MGRAIPDENGSGSFNPTAMLREEGAMLKGTMVSRRDVATTFGPKPVYTFKLIDATCRFILDKQEVPAYQDDVVDAFAPTRLARQLAHINEGETVTITYAGRKKVGRGQPAHIFKVEVD
jgi:hypothetical protein